MPTPTSAAIHARETLETRVLAEQIALMCRLTSAPLFGSLVVGTMFWWLAVEDHGLAVSLLWYGALLLTTFARWRASRAYLAEPRHSIDVQRWRLLVLIVSAIAGAVWSIPGSLLLPSNREKEIVVTILFVGMTASGVGSQAPVRHAYAAVLLPFMLPYAIGQFLLGGDRFISGFATLLYIVVVLVVASRQTDSVERQIRLAIENETLADELRRERDRANQANLELQAQMDRQQRSTEHIATLNRDLESQATELRRVNSDLEGFSYSVSHDLRAPLRAIHGFATLLAQRLHTDTDTESRHYLERINENIRQMSTLIDDLLAFSKCGRQPLDMSNLDMSSLARTAAAEALSAHDLRVLPRMVIDPLPQASGDPHLILQVWRNLLDNAVKYTSKSAVPSILVSGRSEDGRTLFEVTDNGIGFDSRYSESLFGVFQRLHRISDYPGSGVGLAIVQRIVTRHGGEVWARSQPNAGATFGFSLPSTRPLGEQTAPIALADAE